MLVEHRSSGLVASVCSRPQPPHEGHNILTDHGRERWPCLSGPPLALLGGSMATGIIGHRLGYPGACHHWPFFHGHSKFVTSPLARTRGAGSPFHLIRDLGIEHPWRRVAMPGGMPVDQSAAYRAPLSCVAHAPVYKRVSMTILCAATTTTFSPPVPFL